MLEELTMEKKINRATQSPKGIVEAKKSQGLIHKHITQYYHLLIITFKLH